MRRTISIASAVCARSISPKLMLTRPAATSAAGLAGTARVGTGIRFSRPTLGFRVTECSTVRSAGAFIRRGLSPMLHTMGVTPMAMVTEDTRDLPLRRLWRSCRICRTSGGKRFPRRAVGWCVTLWRHGRRFPWRHWRLSWGWWRLPALNWVRSDGRGYDALSLAPRNGRSRLDKSRRTPEGDGQNIKKT